MIQPNELLLNLPMEVANGTISSTTTVWEILQASRYGDVQKVKALVEECPDLIYAQYNYAPPIHFAVIHGHTELVQYLLDKGAHDPAYKIYPFLDTLETIAADKEYTAIEYMLNEYAADTSRHVYKNDNGRIFYTRTPLQNEFEKAVDENDVHKTEQILKQHPAFAKDETYFWGEGILTFAAKENNRLMIDLLMSYGAKVPGILKWTQFYYFERTDGAAYMMEKGMSPNTMSWQHVTILHDMAQKGFIDKAALLIQYGADPDITDEIYQSTPLALAARWGQTEMVQYLLEQGANPNKAGALWATPLVWARKKGFADIEELLLKAGAK